jgi:hypothetical protein
MLFTIKTKLHVSCKENNYSMVRGFKDSRVLGFAKMRFSIADFGMKICYSAFATPHFALP